MGRRSIAFLFLCLTTYTLLSAQSKQGAYTFLNLPASAHTLATGGITLSIVDGTDGLPFDNPALYGQEVTGRLSLSYLNYMLSMHGGNALYGLPVGDRGAWAIGLRAMHYGKIESYDAQNIATGTFSATDAALEGLFSYDLTNKLRGALALKMIYANIERYNAFAIAADAGLSYYDGEKGISLGAALTNLGATIIGLGEKRPMPAWDLRLGYSQTFHHAPFTIHITAYGLNPVAIRNEKLPDQKFASKLLRHFTMAAEYQYQQSFWVALGYNPRLAQDLKVSGGNFLSGFSLGTGFQLPYLGVSIAASRYHPSGLSIMLTLSTDFGQSNSYSRRHF